jgi:hypothetical protein
MGPVYLARDRQTTRQLHPHAPSLMQLHKQLYKFQPVQRLFNSKEILFIPCREKWHIK